MKKSSESVSLQLGEVLVRQHIHTHLRSTQEEADTKILLHAVDAAAHGATEINIHSPDTDVFILSLRRYPQLCHKTNIRIFTKGRNVPGGSRSP